jgi:parallel beta-helix repeat protein
LAALSSAAIILGIVTQVRWSYVVFIDPRDRNLAKARNDITGTIDYSSQDATSVILHVIGALGNGGRILLRAGTYIIAQSLIINGPNGVELYGEGDSTILRLANDVNERVIHLQSVKDWYIHDLQVDGNKANQATSSQKSHGISAWNCMNIAIERTYVHDCRTFGIHLSATGNSKVLNNHVSQCSANGITIDNEGGGQSILVQGNTVDGASDVGITTWHGVDVVVNNNSVSNVNLNESPFGENSHVGIMQEQGSQHVTVSTNRVNNCLGNGLSTSISPAQQMNTDIQLLDNRISNCGKGVYVEGTDRLLVKGNVIDTTSDRGISVDSPADVVQIVNNQLSNVGGQSGIEGTINGLLIDGNTITTVAGNAIVAWGYSNWTVTGNHIGPTQGCAIYLGHGSNNWIIHNNSILNCTTDGIRLEEASYNTIDSNRVSGCSKGVNIADAKATQNVVTSNYLVGNTVDLIDDGTGTLKADNVVGISNLSGEQD